MNLEQGTVISNRYEIAEKIGVGGMANVYRAKDLKLDRDVTFKVLKEEFIKDEDFIRRFSTEAQAAAKLSHPNIVTVYDVGNEGNVNYIVMEYIDGYTLKELIRRKAPFANDEALGVAIQIATALECAHEHNIVHRDIKPQNILVTKDGSIKVTDFGIARATNSNTITTESVGSVHYFSPEQARGVYVDCKSDIYSLGIVLYEMVTGRLPFDGDSPVQLAMKHINDPLPDMKAINPNISDSIEKIILKATEKISSNRYQTAEELNNDLKRALTNETGDFVKLQDYSHDDSPTVVLTKEARDEINSINNDSYNNNYNHNYNNNNNSNDYPDDDYSENYADNYSDNYSNQFVDNDNQQTMINNSNPNQSSYNQTSSQNNYVDEDMNYNKKAERKVIIAAVVTAFSIIALVTALSTWFLKQQSVIEEVVAPNLLNMSFEDAAKLGQQYNIYINKTAEEYSEDAEKGEIIEQSVPAGEKMKVGESIEVTVSLGEDASAEEFDLPDVVGLDQSDAYEKFKDIPISLSYSYENSDTVSIGQIISQSPEGNTKIKAGTKVKLVISRGATQTTTTVPDCLGMTEAEAKATIQSAGLVVGSVTESESSKYDKGQVMTQNPKAGSEVNEGKAITLVISSGKTTDKDTTTNNTDKNSDKNSENDKSDNKSDNKSDSKSENKSDNSSSNDKKSEDETQNSDSKSDEKDTENSDNTESTESPMKSDTITVNPTLDDGVDNVEVKVIQKNDSSSSVEIYSATVNRDSFPISIPVKGNKTTEYQLYIDGMFSGSEVRDFQ